MMAFPTSKLWGINLVRLWGFTRARGTSGSRVTFVRKNRRYSARGALCHRLCRAFASVAANRLGELTTELE